MEEPEKSKPWEKPWTSDEIRRESGSWSLAGDAGLLNHLQHFSQSLLQRTHSTEVSLNKLIEELKTTSTEISNVTNSFLSLANTQFVENRVYDDDDNETPSEDKKKEEEKAKPKTQLEAEVVARIKEALAKGMALLDSHFDSVDVLASDSEEDESSTSTGRVFLEARNPYMMRPLPCMIGSKEFMEDEHVGLGELQSDTEESPDQNLIHSSESEEDLNRSQFGVIPKRPRLSSSSMSENSEPESDRSGTQGKQKKHKVGNPNLETADALEEETDIFGRESPPEADVGVVTERGARNSFAAELASKLGGVAAENSIAHKQEREKSDNLFSPPSESEDDNSLFGHNVGKFSGGKGLFDDLDNWAQTHDSLWGNTEETKARKETEKDLLVKPDNLFSPGTGPNDLFNGNSVAQVDEEGDIFSSGTKNSQKSNLAFAKVIRIAPYDGHPDQNVFTSTPTEASTHISSPSKGLFDEEQNSDLFQADNPPNKTGMPQIPASSSLFDNTDTDDGDLFSVPTNTRKDLRTLQDTTKKKIPVGGVNVLSPIIQQPSAQSSDDVPVESSRSAPISNDSSSGIGKTVTGTFNSSQNAAVGKISLFDSKEDEMFQPTFTSTKKSFHEVGSDSLFANKSSKAPSSAGASKASVKDRKPISFFDDSDSGDDELLFSSTSSTSSRSRRSQGSGDLLAVEKKPLQKKGFFDDENALFAGSEQDDPGFDIFSGIKNNPNSVPKLVPEERNSHSLFFDDSSSKSQKVSHGLFDEFSDPNDDIFAIPPRTGNAAVDQLDVKKALKNNLFLDDDSAVDIFQVSVPKGCHNNLKTSVGASDESSSSSNSSVPCGNTSRISDSVTNRSMDITRTPLVPERSKGSSLFDSPEPGIEDIEKSESISNRKPPIKQKPKISISKPSLFESSSDESDIFLISSKVSSDQNNIKSNDGKSTNNVEKEIIKESQQKVMEEMEKEDQKLNVKLKADQSSQNKSEETSQAVSSIKPEPPRTLNIRKTTDVLFNDEEDLWTTGSLDEKQNVSIVDPSFKTDTLSAILHDYSMESEFDKVVDIPDGGILSVEKQPRTVKENQPNVASDRESTVKPSSSTRSPIKLFIDPTALLPGAKPPNKAVNSESGVSFDAPVDTNAVLHSAGKGRAKIQVKRRPQSRRARQEALRASSIDLDNESKSQEEMTSKRESPSYHITPSQPELKVQAETEPILSKSVMASQSSQTVDKNLVKGENCMSVGSGPNTPSDVTSKPPTSDFFNGNSNPLSPSTDEEDFFAVPQELPLEYDNNKDQVSDEKGNLFGGAPVLSPVDLSARPLLFGDDINSQSHISSSGLFSSSTEADAPVSTIEPKMILFSEKTTLANDGKRDPLVKVETSQHAAAAAAAADDDDDDDLFGSSESSVPRKNLFPSTKVEVKPDEGLFSDVKSKQSVPQVDSKDKRNNNLFLSTADEPLFSTRNTKVLMDDMNTSVTASNNEVKSRNLLFSTDESSSSDLFSVGNKSDTVEPSDLYKTDDLFPSDQLEKNSDNQDASIFPSATIKNQISFSSDNDDLFSSDVSQEKEGNDFFSSGTKSYASKTNSEDESESNLFSNKGSIRRISAAQTVNLFGDNSPESDDLFASSVIITNRKVSSEVVKEDTSGKGSLFEDDGDNIFEATLAKSESKPSSRSVAEAHPQLGLTEEESDLFSSSVISKKNTVRTSKVSSTVLQGQKKDELFEDPLMVIKK